MAASEAVEEADQIVKIVADVFGASLLGAYLHGSGALGGLRPTSDVDVLAVIDRATTESQRRALVNRLMAISDPSRARRKRPVELTVVRDADVKPWRFPPRMEFQYGEWQRGDYERGMVPEPRANADLAPLIAVALMANHALLGPPPAELLDSVPTADLGAAVVEGVGGLLADIEPDTRNVLLTLARIWHTLSTDAVTTKDAAAEWAAERSSPRSRATLLRARDQYEQGTHGEWQQLLDDARATADELVAAIEAAAQAE